MCEREKEERKEEEGGDVAVFCLEEGKEEVEVVTVFEKIKKTVFFTRLSVFVIVILYQSSKKKEFRFRVNRNV